MKPGSRYQARPAAAFRSFKIPLVSVVRQRRNIIALRPVTLHSTAWACVMGLATTEGRAAGVPGALLGRMLGKPNWTRERLGLKSSTD